jgi:hypothetical protein
VRSDGFEFSRCLAPHQISTNHSRNRPIPQRISSTLFRSVQVLHICSRLVEITLVLMSCFARQALQNTTQTPENLLLQKSRFIYLFFSFCFLFLSLFCQDSFGAMRAEPDAQRLSTVTKTKEQKEEEEKEVGRDLWCIRRALSITPLDFNQSIHQSISSSIYFEILSF